MAILGLWAGSSGTVSNWTLSNNKLPSPISVDITREQIWDADAGRSSSTGEMVATYIASKRTYAIKWGVLSTTEFSKITGLLTTGFFYFGEGGVASDSDRPSSVSKYYRSEISYSVLQAASGKYYKDVSVSVIQV